MTKQKIVISVAHGHSEENDCDSDGAGKHIKSPAFMPFKEWSITEALVLSPSALSNSKHSHSTAENLHENKPSSPHKLYKGHKFPSMSNLHAAEEEGTEEVPVSSPKASPTHGPAGEKEFVCEITLGHASETELCSTKSPTLDHTVGSIPSWSKMRKSRSYLDITHPDEEHEETAAEVPGPLTENRPGRSLLFVLDMDHTMVGNLVALSDRDNIETNIDWNYWPEGINRGLSVEDIIPYLERGMLRPGLSQLLQHLNSIGATVVVYTHSEKRWASKVCEAMQRIVGWPFITRLFSRQDCRDGHAHFLARKSLEHVVMKMHEELDFRWSKVEMAVMFDDDPNALNGTEQCRLIQVPSYDYWEPCPWNTVVTDELMDRNKVDVADMARRSVVEWGIAEPSYADSYGMDKSPEVAERDRKWSVQQQRKQNILLSYNKVAKLDRVMHSLREVLITHPVLDEPNLESLPERFRLALGDAHAAAAAAGPSLSRRVRRQL